MLPRAAAEAFARAPGRILSTRELVRLGFHRTQPAGWVVDGLAERLLHGIYRDADGEVPDDQCLHLATRYIGQRATTPDVPAVFSGAPVLALERVEGFELPCRPLVLVAGGSDPRSTPQAFSRRRVDLAEVAVRHLLGHPTTFPDRAVADAALDRDLSDRQIRTAVDQLRWDRKLWLPDAVATWQALGHAGARRLVALYDAGAFDQESEGERRAFRLLFEDHPPLPDCQVVIVGQLRVDFVFLSAMLIIEYHGNPHDGRTEADATRRHALERLGYRVIVVTKSMLADAGGLARFIHTERVHREQLVAAGALPRAPLPIQPPRRLPLRTLHPAG